MTNYRDYSNLTADPTAAAAVYTRLADLRDDAAKPTAPRSGMALVGIRAAVQRFVTAQPTYTGPAALRF